MIEDEIDTNLRRIADEKATTKVAKQRILKARLEFGRKTSELAEEFPSKKVLGQEIARRYPASQKMDAALRSNCRWLHEALNKPGHTANDILTVLRVPSIYDVGSENPVSIRRIYNKAKKAPRP